MEGGRRKGKDRLDKLSEHLRFFTALSNDVLDLRHVLRHLARFSKRGREGESERRRAGGRVESEGRECYREMIEKARERARDGKEGEKERENLCV